MLKKEKKKKINYKETFKEVWTLVRKYKRYLFPALITANIVNILYFFNTFLFRELIKQIELYLQGDIIQDILLKSLLVIAIIFIIIRISTMILQWLDLHFRNRLDNNIIADVRKKYFPYILSLDNEFHTTHKTGSLISRFTRAANSLEGVFDSILYEFFPLILRLLFFIPAIFFIGWREGILVITLIIIFLIYSGYFIGKFNRENKLKNKLVDKENGTISDVFTNIDSIKYFAKEVYITKEYNKILNKVKKQELKSWEIWKKIQVGQTFILAFFLFFILYISINRFLAKEIMLADITFLYMAVMNITGKLYSFDWSVRRFTKSLVDIQDLFEYGKYKNNIKDKKNAKNIIIKEGTIEFKNIKFEYLDDNRKVFNNLNLFINSGETIALVGDSGCGKSTLIKLLYRFYNLDKGKILIDGQNIADVKKKSLRKNLSIVPQEAILFDDTIFNNIKFSRTNATNKEVWEAIKYAELYKFIKSLKKKEKTIVGERGIRLSGGQKQRVSIARAILADRKILLLDEATSSLDTKTKIKIQKSLDYLMKNRTSIVIAHRLSTVMRADKIIVIKKGEIIQTGKHKDLIKEKGDYKTFWDLQKR